MGRKEDALDYHQRGRKGKIEVVPTKPLVSQIDLSNAYTPGVAEPCLAIHADEEKSFAKNDAISINVGSFIKNEDRRSA